MKKAGLHISAEATAVQGPRGLSIKEFKFKETLSNGDNVYQVILENNTVIGELTAKKGDKGLKGDTGDNGNGIIDIKAVEKVDKTNNWEISYTNGKKDYISVQDGDSAFEVAVDNGFTWEWTGEGEEPLDYGVKKWLESLIGKGLEFEWRGTELGVRVEGETEYKYVNLKGQTGEAGRDGINGKNLEFTWRGTELGVRVQGQSAYQYVNLKGAKGDPGTNGKNGTDGVGIKTVTFKGTDSKGGNVYIITLTNGSTYEFTAPKGSDGASLLDKNMKSAVINCGNYSKIATVYMPQSSSSAIINLATVSGYNANADQATPLTITLRSGNDFYSKDIGMSVTSLNFGEYPTEAGFVKNGDYYDIYIKGGQYAQNVIAYGVCSTGGIEFKGEIFDKFPDNIVSNENSPTKVRINIIYTKSEIDTKFKNYPVPVGGILLMYNTSNPAELYSGTTWELLATDKYLKTTTGTPLSTGGSNSFAISKANLPAIKIQLESFSVTTQPHTHNLHVMGCTNQVANIHQNAVHTDNEYHGQVDLRNDWNYAKSGGGANTGTASPYTQNLGSGTTISINPTYITVRAWKRLT